MKLKDFDVIFAEGSTDIFTYVKQIAGKYTVFALDGLDSTVQVLYKGIESRKTAVKLASDNGSYSGELIF